MNKKIFLVLSTFCFVIVPMINAMDEKDLAHYDSYAPGDATYSDCRPLNMSFEKFPTRFVACLFCRKPEKKYRDDIRSYSCLMCKAAIQDALERGIERRDFYHRQVLEIAIHQYLSMADVLQGRKYIVPLMDFKVRDKVFGEHYHGLIMYKGALQLPNGNLRHVWQKELDVSGFDKYLVKVDRTGADWWHEGEPLVRDICEKYNIFGPETGEPLSAPVAGETVTYEEVVAQFPSSEVGTAAAGVGLLR